MSELHTKNRYLYISLEIFNRELNGMLLLSLVATMRGWQVIFGGSSSILPHVGIFPSGVFLTKSSLPSDIERVNNMRNHGHKVVSLDAEGLIPSNGESSIRIRYGEKTVKMTDRLFFWGSEQFNNATDVFPEIKKLGSVTGSPVFDYWRLLKSSHIKQKNDGKKIILIATSFSYANHVLGSKQPYQAVRSAGFGITEKKYIDDMLLDGVLQEATFPYFQAMVERLAREMPDNKIILRPHPTENVEVWKNIANAAENIELQCSGEICPWLLSSDIFIHSNSTAAIEAKFFGKEVITFVPELEEKIEARLSSPVMRASKVCRTIDEVVIAVNQSINNEKIENAFDLNTIIKDASSNNITASCENILDVLDEFELVSQRKVIPNRLNFLFDIKAIKLKLRARAVWVVAWLDYLLNIFSGKYASMRNYYRYGKSKQGKLNKKEVYDQLKEYSRVLGIKDDELDLVELQHNLFLLKNKV